MPISTTTSCSFWPSAEALLSWALAMLTGRLANKQEANTDVFRVKQRSLFLFCLINIAHPSF